MWHDITLLSTYNHTHRWSSQIPISDVNTASWCKSKGQCPWLFWRNVPIGLVGPPFVKRFALCYQTVVCLSVCLSCPVCLSVMLVYCGQTVGGIEMKLGVQVGLGLGHIVLDGDPAPPPPKGHSPQFLAHICCGQMAAWIKMSLGMELGLGPGD